MSPIYRDFSLDDLRPALTSAGIGAAVLVQAAPTIAETRFLLDVARNSGGLVRGVVGWADLAAPDAVPTIEKLAANRLLKSMRPMLQDLEDPCWITQPQVAIALRALAGLGLRFDALVTPRELPWLLETLPRHPKLAVVVDHCAKPDIAHAVWQPWAADIAALAADTYARAKTVWFETDVDVPPEEVSKLMATFGLDPERTLSQKLSPAALNAMKPLLRRSTTKLAAIDHLRPYVDHIMACFGTRRVMWGSDWPVVTLAASYDDWLTTSDALLGWLTPTEREAVCGGNAARFYGLDA